MDNAEFAALVLLVQDWDSIAPWLIEELFDDEANRMAFVALAEADGDLDKAIEIAAPDAATCSSGRRSPISTSVPTSRHAP